MPVDLSWTFVPVFKWQSATPGGTYSLLQQVFAHELGAAILLTSNSIIIDLWWCLCYEKYWGAPTVMPFKSNGHCAAFWMIWVNWQKLQCLNLLLLVACAQRVCVSPLSYCELFDECSGDAFWLVQLLGFIKSSANIKIALATLSSGWNKWNVCYFSKWWSSAFVMWKEDSEGLNWKEWKCLRASGCFIPLCPSVLIYSCTCQKKEAPMRCEYRSRNPPLLFVVGISSSPNEVLFCLSFLYVFVIQVGQNV